MFLKNKLLSGFVSGIKRKNSYDAPATTKFLERFFSNLILVTEYELKNRYMDLDYIMEEWNSVVQSEIENNPKGKICTLNCPLDELDVLQLIMENPEITQKK